jgi:hypothetical protein
VLRQHPPTVAGLLSSQNLPPSPLLLHVVSANLPGSQKLKEVERDDRFEVVDLVDFKNVLLDAQQRRVVLEVDQRHLIGKLEQFCKEIDSVLLFGLQVEQGSRDCVHGQFGAAVDFEEETFEKSPSSYIVYYFEFSSGFMDHHTHLQVLIPEHQLFIP